MDGFDLYAETNEKLSQDEREERDLAAGKSMVINVQDENAVADNAFVQSDQTSTVEPKKKKEKKQQIAYTDHQKEALCEAVANAGVLGASYGKVQSGWRSSANW
jgi:hypothetical protein